MSNGEGSTLAPQGAPTGASPGASTTPADQPVTSRGIVRVWAKLPTLPKREDDLKALWAGSKEPLASNWDAGAAILADKLRPHARKGQVIDQPFIQGLSPCTAGKLEDTLGW